MIRNFSQEGEEIVFGQEPEIGDGVRGLAFDTSSGIYISFLRAEREGAGDVSRFLNALPRDRRIVFPTVINARLEEMLLRRGFTHSEVEMDGMPGVMVEIMERLPVFERGDKLVCIDDTESGGALVKGETYVVDIGDGGESFREMVLIAGLPGLWWGVGRFRKMA